MLSLRSLLLVEVIRGGGVRNACGIFWPPFLEKAQGAIISIEVAALAIATIVCDWNAVNGVKHEALDRITLTIRATSRGRA